MKRVWIISVVLLLLVLSGCASKSQKSEVDGMEENTGYKQISQEEAKEMMSRDDGHVIVAVKVGEDIFTIDLEDNSSADAFYEKLKEGNIEIVMDDYGSFEKVGDLPWKLPTNDEEITTEPGDLILYQGDKITVYYDENTWNFTKLGRLNATSEEIKEVFGDKDEITASFFLE